MYPTIYIIFYQLRFRVSLDCLALLQSYIQFSFIERGNRLVGLVFIRHFYKTKSFGAACLVSRSLTILEDVTWPNAANAASDVSMLVLKFRRAKKIFMAININFVNK